MILSSKKIFSQVASLKSFVCRETLVLNIIFPSETRALIKTFYRLQFLTNPLNVFNRFYFLLCSCSLHYLNAFTMRLYTFIDGKCQACLNKLKKKKRGGGGRKGNRKNNLIYSEFFLLLPIAKIYHKILA